MSKNCGEVSRTETTRLFRASRPQVSCRPASGWRPLGSASDHKALGALRAARASGSPAAGPSRTPGLSAGRAPSAPSHPRATERVTQPGIGARGPRRPRARPGGKHWQATRPRRSSACPPQHVSVCLARGRPPRPPVLGPLGWGLAPPRGGNRPPPFLPPARRAWPRGGRVSSHPSPAPDKVKLSRWRSFLAQAARSQLPQLPQFEVSTAGDKRSRVSPSWCSLGERQPALRTPGAPTPRTLGARPARYRREKRGALLPAGSRWALSRVEKELNTTETRNSLSETEVGVDGELSQ